MMLQLSGLWLNESKDGNKKYMVGYMGNLKILVFKNDHKTEDKQPDYVMYLADKVQHSTDEATEENTPF